MIIVFNCPGCGAILRMKEQYGGQRGRCPHCQGAITVPAIATDEGMDLMPLDGAGAAPPSQTPAGGFSLGSRLPPAAPAPAATSSTPPSPFSVASRATPGEPSPAGARAPSVAGDSNIGLAPLEEAPAKRSTPPAAAAAVQAPAEAAKPKSTEDDFSLAPLEGSSDTKTTVHATAKTVSAPALKNGGGNNAAQKPATEEPQRVVCAKCGARMRVPPNAAGRTIICPKCKNKQRVPDESVEAAPASTKSPSSSDTISLEDTPSVGQDLDGLDILGESAGSKADAGPATGAAGALAGAKLSSGKSKGTKSGAILGMPPLVVYAGGGGVALLLIGLLGFILFSGPRTPSAATTPAPGPVAQSPTPTPAPQTTAAAPAAAAPIPGGAASGVAAAAKGPSAPAMTPTGTMPAAPASASGGAVNPTAWRERIPLVRLSPDAEPQAGEATVAPSDPTEPTQLVNQAKEAQTQLLADVKQIVDVEAAKRLAPQAAESTAKGLDAVRKLRRLGGPPKASAAQPPQPGNLRAGVAAALAKSQGKPAETDISVQIEAEIERAVQIPGVLPAFEAALAARAAQEPDGALAAALAKLGVLPAGGPVK